MSNKKSATTGISNEAGAHNDTLNVLYAAHQVHTLAQILFQQLSGNWPQRTWTPAGSAYGSPYGAAVPSMMPTAPQTIPCGVGFTPPVPPALFYWYP